MNEKILQYIILGVTGIAFVVGIIGFMVFDLSGSNSKPSPPAQSVTPATQSEKPYLSTRAITATPTTQSTTPASPASLEDLKLSSPLGESIRTQLQTSASIIDALNNYSNSGCPQTVEELALIEEAIGSLTVLVIANTAAINATTDPDVVAEVLAVNAFDTSTEYLAATQRFVAVCGDI